MSTDSPLVHTTILMERQTTKINPLISYLRTIIQASPRGLRPDIRSGAEIIQQ